MVVPRPAPPPPAALVVIGGLPGAGKTTLLRRLDAAALPGVHALDAEDVACRMGAALARRGTEVP